MRLLLAACIALSCTSPKPANIQTMSAGVDSPASVGQERESASAWTAAIDLRDGSRIIGTPLVTGLTLGSSFGPVAFRFEQVASIVFSDSAKGGTRVGFVNGDILQGSVQIDSLPVRFAAGRMSIPVSAILRISPLPSEKDLAEGLIAHYPLAGNTKDASGGGHDAVNHGAVPGPDRFGRRGRAYEFDGGAARISLPERILDPEGEACTLSVWVLARSTREFREALYIGAATAELGISVAHGRFGFGADLRSQRWVSVETPAQENSFVNLTGVYERGKSLRLYVNGERKSDAPLPDEPLFSGYMEYTSGIGAYAPDHPEQGKRLGVSNWFGSISDVRIYSRALSDGEIMALAHLRE